MQSNILRNAAMAVMFTTVSAVSAFAADLSPFTRVEATYTDSGYDNFRRSANNLSAREGYYAIGTQLTIGAVLGSSHEISFTTGYTKWEGDQYGPVGVASISHDIEQVPLLLNYRYHYKLFEKLTLVFGPSAGLVHETATDNVLRNDWPVVGLKPVGTYSDSAWKTAFGGGLGISYAVAQGWEINAAAQILRLDSKNYDLAGTTLRAPYDSVTRIGFSLGVGYHW